MSPFGKAFGRGRAASLAQARAAELRGELAQAAALFAQAGRLDEAARVMVLRGDAETDPAARLRHYVQAVGTAPDDSPARPLARKKRALLVLAMAADVPDPAPLGPALRQDVALAARELEDLTDFGRAAEAYARIGDVEGEARCLARAGEIDRLDALLVGQQARDRESLARRHAHEELAVLVASGRRREAAALARESPDETLRERGRALEARRVSGHVVRAAIRGHETRLVLGEEVIVGRTGTIAIASAAVSRQHVAIARRDGEVVVRDLGSRNGTTLRGLALAGEARVGEGLELRLGNEVPLVVYPAAAGELAGAVAVEIAGTRYVAPLGPAALGVGRWRLESPGDWVELVTDDAPPAFAGSLRLAARVTLLVGDAVAQDRGGPAVFEVHDGAR